MEKIDRLGWAAGLACTAYGVRVGIRVGETDVLKRVEIYLPPAWSPASSPRVDILYSVVVGGAGSRPGVRRFNLLYANAHRVADPWTSGRFLTPLKRMSICISLRPPPVGVSCTLVSSAGEERRSSFPGGATAAKVHWSRPW